jgi:hypothetical protein
MSGRDPWSLVNALVLSAIAIAAVTVWVLAGLGGWEYYTTPMRVRGYAPPHRILKPSGTIAHPLGVAGLLMMVVPLCASTGRRLPGSGRCGAGSSSTSSAASSGRCW